MNNKKMPVVFVGHGSPMNAIEDNKYSRGWKALGSEIPRPKGIVSVSAHWVTRGTCIQEVEQPKQIYDMSGFPRELYEVEYPVKGDGALGERIRELNEEITINNDWGIDHGTWSVLVHMYPEYDIPVVQLSLDRKKTLQEHWQLGKTLQQLREEGILIFCSGNVVHNLRRLDYYLDGPTKEAEAFDLWVKQAIENRDLEALYKIEKAPFYEYAVPTYEHYLPLIYAFANSTKEDDVTVFNKGGMMGSLTMTSYLISAYK